MWLGPNVFVIADDLIVNKLANSGKQTIWRLNYNNEINDAVLNAEAGAFMVAPDKPDATGALFARLFMPAEFEMSKEYLKPQGANWIACGQVQVSMHNLFKNSTTEEIVAVLSVLESGSDLPPSARKITGDGFMGAVVDENDRSRAAVFVTDNDIAAGMKSITLDVSAEKQFTCLFFGLEGNTSYVAQSIGNLTDGGKITYAIGLNKGAGASTNEAGTLVIYGQVNQ